MRKLITTIAIFFVTTAAFPQEQGYLTNGKERLRADANMSGAAQKLPPPPATSRGEMIGSADANSVTLAMKSRQLDVMLAQLEQQQNLLTTQENQRITELQRIRNMTQRLDLKDLLEIQRAVDALIAKEQQASITRRAWYDQFRANWQQMYSARQTAAPARDLKGLDSNQGRSSDMLMQQQQRRQSEITGIESR